MKPTKVLGTIMLALVAMALGPSSAEAESTALCEEDEAACASPITHLHATSPSKAKLLSSVINVECDVLFLGGTTVSLASPLRIEGNFTYSNCNSGCVVTEENGPAELDFLKEGHETADLSLEWLMHANCAGFMNCVFNGVGLEGIAKGALLASELENPFGEGKLNKESGSLCPKTTRLDYLILSLTPIHITS